MLRSIRKHSAMEIGDAVSQTPLEQSYGRYWTFCTRIGARPATFARWLEMDKGVKSGHRLERESKPNPASADLRDTAPSRLTVWGS